MKKLITILLATLLTLSFTSCSSNKSTDNTTQPSTSSEKVSDIKVEIIINESKNELENKKLTVSKDSNLMEILQSNFKIEEKDGFITAINDKAQDENEGIYWTYTVNEEMPTVGAGEYILQDKDKVVFSLDKFENE